MNRKKWETRGNNLIVHSEDGGLRHRRDRFINGRHRVRKGCDRPRSGLVDLQEEIGT
jgi:hypothetical protein